MVALFALGSNTGKSQNKMKVIYVYDALCGWCYGFSPVISQFETTYQDSVEVEVLSGGMVTGSRIGPIGEVAPYISWAYKDVENGTGVKFGTVFLEQTLKKGTAIFTSVPPSIALSVFKSLSPHRHLSFAAALQKAIYFDGIEPENTAAYGSLAEKFGLDGKKFVAAMNDAQQIANTEKEFEQSSSLGVTGFPTVFVESGGSYHKIASGYVPFKVLEENFLALKNKLKQ